MKKAIIIVSLMLFMACTSRDIQYEALKLTNKESLTYTTIIQNIPVKHIFDFVIADSLIILKGKDDESCFFVYNKKTGAHVSDFFKIGRGPFEGVAPRFVETTGDSCIITESNLRRGYLFSLSALLNGEPNFYREFKFDFPKERTQMMAHHPIHLGENRYLMVVPFSHEERFAIYTNPFTPGEKEVKHIYREYPQVVEDSKEANAAVLGHINQYAVSPDKSKCVHLSFIGAIAETFELQKDTMLPLAMKTYLKPEYEWIGQSIAPKNDGMIGFVDVITSNRYFYAIYANGRYDATTDDHREIVMFDWQINPIKLYTLRDLILFMKQDAITGDVYAVIKNLETLEYDLVKFDKQFIE